MTRFEKAVIVGFSGLIAALAAWEVIHWANEALGSLTLLAVRP